MLAATGVLTVVSWYAYGRKHYSGPIRAVTKWETGVEIDLASTLGPRSRPSAMTTDPSRPGVGEGDDEGDGKQHIEDGALGVPTVTINRAWSGSGQETTGDSAEWTDVSVLESRATGLDNGVHSRRSFENP